MPTDPATTATTATTAASIALDMLRFIDSSPTSAHAALESVRVLKQAGFSPLNEKDTWSISPGSRHCIVRNQSAILAFRVGTKSPEESGFRIIGAHTDFPGLRLKPNGIYSKNGYVQLGVEIYGGPILATWTDRDLGLAGRAAVKNDDGSIAIRLFNLNRPLCRIPNVAIHMNRDVNDEGLKLNKQDNLPPVIALGDDTSLESAPLTKLVADEIGIAPEKILDIRFEVVDIQPGSVGGLNGEFVFSGRIDNLASCHAALKALMDAPDGTPFTQVVALFDNEEVGSQTAGGAGSRFLDNVLERLCMTGPSPREAFFRSTELSMMISADGAHAVNPNYPEAHDPHHQPILNGGPVLKVNAQERYTTEIEASAHLKSCADRAGIKLQTFVARSDKPTGSTIGPMTASRLGIKSVDIGIPMLSMHSIREMGGVNDQEMMINILREHLSK
jgi:aspartyl aminopeptidase